jgi:hypothetical protein
MKSLLRSRLTSFAAMVVYLAVNIGVAALHQHPGPPHAAHKASTSPLEFGTASLADSDEHDENCTLCNVLHQARILVASLNVETLNVPSAETIPAPTPFLPAPRAICTNARSPPPV